MQAGSRQWWQVVVTVFCIASVGLPPCSRPTERHVSPASKPFRLWHAVTHALQPEQRSRSTSKLYCCPAAGGDTGIRLR